MKIVVLPQVTANKGDRAVLHFMLEGFVNAGVDEVTVVTTNPAMWDGYSNFRGMNVRFVHQAWMIHARAETEVPFRSFRYYCLRVVSKLRAKFYGKFGYYLLRTAVVRGKFLLLAKLMCYLCNREQWNAIKRCDAVVTSGGHRITTLLRPDVVGQGTFSMAMVILASKKLYLWSQTIGAFDFKKDINRQLIKRIINHSERIYVRDINSTKELKAFSCDESRIHQTCDSVFGLSLSVMEHSEIPPSIRGRVIGLSVYTGKSGRNIEYQPYIHSLAQLARRVSQDGFTVKFFPMHIADINENQYFLDIMEQSGCATKCQIVDSHIDTIEHLKQVSECQLFVGHKTHSIIFALLTATPLIAIAYHIKSLDFMKQFGLEEYGFDESETSPEKLISLYEKILIDIDRVHDTEKQKADIMGKKVNQDFMELISHLRQTS